MWSSPDVDYHAGNGTQDIFYDRDDVLTISIHADPDFRVSALSSGLRVSVAEAEVPGSIHNFPLPKGAGDAEYLYTLDKALALIREFKPVYLVVSAGMDIYADDPLGTGQSGHAGHRRNWGADRVAGTADGRCDGRGICQ
ncbi:MAG: hypothetical protein MZV64_23200 [Ignavibacteriales bacterium]|nr:hypothetical protein [Ignavibacteriales bacterium]